MNVITGSKLIFEEGKVEVDVCKAIEDMRNDAIMEEKIEIAMNMLADGTVSHEKIAKFTKLPLEKIEELAKTKTVSV